MMNKYINIDIHTDKIGTNGCFILELNKYSEEIIPILKEITQEYYLEEDNKYNNTELNKKIDSKDFFDKENACKILLPINLEELPFTFNSELTISNKLSKILGSNLDKYTTYSEKDPVYKLELEQSCTFTINKKINNIVTHKFKPTNYIYIIRQQKCLKNLREFIEDNNEIIYFNNFIINIEYLLQKLHNESIYHGDIKTDNIVIYINNEIHYTKLIDYSGSYVDLEITSTPGYTLPLIVFEKYSYDKNSKIYKEWFYILYESLIISNVKNINKIEEIINLVLTIRYRWTNRIILDIYRITGKKLEIELKNDSFTFLNSYKNNAKIINNWLSVHNIFFNNIEQDLQWKYYLYLKNDEYGLAMCLLQILVKQIDKLSDEERELFKKYIRNLLNPELVYYFMRKD